MKLVFDLSKSLDKTKLVQVQRTVQGKHGQYQRMQWVKPSDVKDTDKVVGGQPVNKDSSDKPIKDGQTLYFKNGESIYSKDGKITRTFKGGVKTEISQDEADRVIPFLTKKYGKTEAPTKSSKHAPFADVSSQPPSASEPKKSDSTDSKEELKVGQKVKYDGMRYKIDSINGNKVTMTARSTDNYSVNDPRYKNGDLTRTVDKSELLPKDSEPKKSDKPYNPDKPVNIDDFKFIDYRNPDGQNTSNRKTYKSALKDWAEQTEKLYNKAMKNYWGDTPPEKQLTTEFMNLNREASIRDLVSNSSEDGLKEARDAIYARQKKLIEMSKKYTKWDSSKREWTEGSSKESSTSKDSVPTKALGKTWSDTKTELGKMGYKVDSIFSSQPPQPKEKLILYKDGKEYEAEVTKYHNGDYEILGSSIKEVKNDTDTKKDESDKPKLTDPTTPTNPSDIKVGDYIYYEDNEGDGGIKGVTQVKEIKKVVIPKTGKTMYVFNEHGRHDRVSCLEGKTVKKYDTKSKQDNKSSNPSTDVKQDSDKKSGKFSMSEFTGMKSDRTKAIQYLKDNGISWKETDNEGINWMRACMAASRAENPAQGATKKDSASKSSSDTKASGKSTEEAKKAVKDLLSENNNDRAKVMQIAKASGVTWKESDNDGINWMRASLAIQKHHESGKTISASASDDKKDDTKTDDKPSAKKVSISDLKRPASNNTSTNLVAGNYNISVTKLRNVGANAKQHPSFYRIVVEKDGDRVFYTDKTDWSDIKEHAKRYIDSVSSSDSKSDKKSDSNPTHDNPLVTTETKSGKPYQIWESNGRIYGSLPGKQDSRNVRDIRDFTSSGFETLDEVKDYIKKYF